MKPSEIDSDAILRALLRAYRDRETAAASGGWQAGVMRRVRTIGPLRSTPDRLMLFGQFVWRFAPVAGLVLFVAGAILLRFDFTPESNLLMSFFSDAEEITLAQLFPF